jgi:two-component system, LytTR family, sensor kinase
MQFSLPKYTSKDYLVLAVVIVPFSLFINMVAFQMNLLSSLGYFLVTTVSTMFAFSIFFTVCGAVAVLMKKRFPAEKQVGTRLALMISSFLIMSGLFLFLLFNVYAAIPYFRYSFNENNFVWAYFSLGIGNIFLTFLHEGIDRYENWTKSRDETNKLRATYQRSRLQGLRSQVNPHFLFNSLNSLSSLISEEGDEAEKFLDEMSKVYRYMLRSESDTMVTLNEELKFLESYYFLLSARYGNGLQMSTQIADEQRMLLLPPLSLQVIIENIITQNSISKTTPLRISITAMDSSLFILNNIQPKTIKDDLESDAALDNLLSKYRLLNQQALVTEKETERIIRLPLLQQQEEVVV